MAAKSDEKATSEITALVGKFTTDALDEIKDINKGLKENNIRINSVDNAISSLKITVSNLVSRLEKHGKFIDGNGADGAKTVISNLKKDVGSLCTRADSLESDTRCEIKKLRGFFNKIVWLLITVLIGIIVNFGWMVSNKPD